MGIEYFLHLWKEDIPAATVEQTTEDMPLCSRACLCCRFPHFSDVNQKRCLSKLITLSKGQNVKRINLAFLWCAEFLLKFILCVFQIALLIRSFLWVVIIPLISFVNDQKIKNGHREMKQMSVLMFSGLNFDCSTYWCFFYLSKILLTLKHNQSAWYCTINPVQKQLFEDPACTADIGAHKWPTWRQQCRYGMEKTTNLWVRACYLSSRSGRPLLYCPACTMKAWPVSACSSWEVTACSGLTCWLEAELTSPCLLLTTSA